MRVESATLVVRSVGRCYLSCPFCPWKLNNSSFLDRSSLEVTVDALIGSMFKPDTYFICPDPLAHPGLGELIQTVRERRLHVTVFVPASTRVREVNWSNLLKADQIFLFSYNGDELFEAGPLIRYLLMKGVSVKLMAFVVPGMKLDEFESIMAYAQRRGLELWASLPILCPISECPINLVKLMKSWGFHVTEPIGEFMSVYMVRMAFKGDYPVRVVEGPMCRKDCRLLFLDSNGLVGKCPASTFLGISSPLEFAAVVRKGCTRVGEKVKYSFVTSVKLVTSEGAEIDERDLDLLALLEEVGSLSSAAKMLGVSTPSVLRRVRKVEELLGMRLLVSRRGGVDRGGVFLTPEARELITKYKSVKSTSSVLSKFT